MLLFEKIYLLSSRRLSNRNFGLFTIQLCYIIISGIKLFLQISISLAQIFLDLLQPLLSHFLQPFHLRFQTSSEKIRSDQQFIKTKLQSKQIPPWPIRSMFQEILLKRPKIFLKFQIPGEFSFLYPVLNHLIILF